MIKGSLSDVNVLLIEDDEDDYVLTLDYLESIANFNFNLVWHSQYNQALEALESNEYDLCLLDYQLGPKTGLSILKEAKARDVHTPIIMLTGQSDAVLDDEALKAGAEDFVLKSEIGSVRFIRSIRYALARKELELERFKKHFEQNFYGIPLYKEAGCSNARLSEYLNCLISTDDSDCRIYYTQMRIVD